MPRNKKRRAAANTQIDRAVREAHRAKRPSGEAGDADHDIEPVLKDTRPTCKEGKPAMLEKRNEPVPEQIQKYIIEKEPDMANYKMVYNQEPSTHALLLRFPNRKPDQPYNARLGQKPSEIRIKPKYGHIEVDVPIIIDQHWDIAKAIEYQHAMQKSTVLQQGRSYGLAGGLGNQSAPNKKAGDQSTTKEPNMEVLLANPADANNKGHVMNKITLAGRIFPKDDTQPRYLCGVFRDGEHVLPSRIWTNVFLTR
ncbi:MAG: hypothetical protein Q9209_002342 [Squamulea sp. 1 TL-2023]